MDCGFGSCGHAGDRDLESVMRVSPAGSMREGLVSDFVVEREVLVFGLIEAAEVQ